MHADLNMWNKSWSFEVSVFWFLALLIKFHVNNSSKDFQKWTAIGCHNLNHLVVPFSWLICWFSGHHQAFRFLVFFRSAICWLIHTECSTVWCGVFRSWAYPFRFTNWKVDIELDGFFVTCLPVHLRKLLTMKLWKLWRARKRGLSRHIFQLLDMSNQFFWKICMHSFLWSGGLFYHHESWPCLQSYQVHLGYPIPPRENWVYLEIHAISDMQSLVH